MSTPDHIRRQEIAALTEARLTFGARGRPLETGKSLQFSLDHAKAREAVVSELDVPRIQTALRQSGLQSQVVTSAAGTRDVFIRRPDLGRQLPDDAAKELQNSEAVDVALVLGDGLSAVAVALNGSAFMAAIADLLHERGLSTSAIICARQARVALGDHVALALQAETVVMALGERPGLTAADSLGVYITHLPTSKTQDSQRNCISNIRHAGTNVAQAAAQSVEIVMAMRATGLSGVGLNQARANTALNDPTDQTKGIT